jgi:hypothetical protein
MLATKQKFSKIKILEFLTSLLHAFCYETCLIKTRNKCAALIASASGLNTEEIKKKNVSVHDVGAEEKKTSVIKAHIRFENCFKSKDAEKLSFFHFDSIYTKFLTVTQYEYKRILIIYYIKYREMTALV